jgi:glutamyl-tRNA synthetase
LSEVKVRFAPSPTGYLHVGGARTALFNYLFARHSKGKFILRIEDTDRQRSSDEFLEDILQSLKWLGIEWDEEPVFQSQRLNIYQEFAEKLLNKGLAYEEKTEKGVGIRFKANVEKVKFKDLIRGEIEFSQGFEDIVIMKSDGTPTYNFACVIDDANLGITHIIRGEDHISNTPKQLLLYQALGFKEPLFAHLPLILGPDRTRLSKRHGAVSLSEYRRQGFLPQALFNFLALLGWSPGDNRELLSRKELINLFDLDRINKSNAVFDIEKLKWMNKKYLKQVGEKEFKEKVLQHITEPELKKEFISLPEEKKEKLYQLLRPRIKVYFEFQDYLSYILSNRYQFEAQAVEKFLKEDKIKTLIGELANRLKALDDFQERNIEQTIRSLAEEKGLQAKEIIHPLRVVLTGREISPPLFELMEIIGRENVLFRIDKFLSSSLPSER